MAHNSDGAVRLEGDSLAVSEEDVARLTLAKGQPSDVTTTPATDHSKDTTDDSTAKHQLRQKWLKTFAYCYVFFTCVSIIRRHPTKYRLLLR